jgi:hypothetical protein
VRKKRESERERERERSCVGDVLKIRPELRLWRRRRTRRRRRSREGGEDFVCDFTAS